MEKELPRPEQGASVGTKTAAGERKPYRQPRVLSRELLEVVAATCDGGKAVFTGGDACGTVGPIQS